MPHQVFDTDAEGNIITKPVVGWATRPVAGMAVLVQIQYADTPEQLENLEKGCSRIQLVLTPQQSLELAETLTTQAKRIMTHPDPGSRQ
jgi:hypothetical protein